MNWLAAAVVGGGNRKPPGLPECPVYFLSGPGSKEAICDLLKWFAATGAEHLLLCLSPEAELSSACMERLRQLADTGGAAIAFSDYSDERGNPRPLVDYQLGSLRDDFDFGALVLLNGKCLAGLVSLIENEVPDLLFAGWYELRLRLVERGQVLRMPEPLYRFSGREDRPSGQKVFDYLDPQKRDYQLEMEQAATRYLKRIGAWLPPPRRPPLPDDRAYPIEASVVIPVKDRARTIADAVQSALSQRASFAFNVIVVDNHSQDGTSDILAGLARRDRRLVHLIPERTDLLIGGCWNLAVFSDACGRFAVQLDSDDLYDGDTALERMIGELRRGPFALVIGSYTIVDFNLRPLPPGLIDHREWSDENGHNNALRVAGLGAPRAFHVPTLRSIGFPNVSYGEDYAVALKICRSFRVGRIYESLYWCRRWEDNTDAHLSTEAGNRHAAYKDALRTEEILARQKLAQ